MHHSETMGGLFQINLPQLGPIPFQDVVGINSDLLKLHKYLNKGR